MRAVAEGAGVPRTFSPSAHLPPRLSCRLQYAAYWSLHIATVSAGAAL